MNKKLPTKRKHAIVIFNLGGPTNLKAVRPFLFNLFNDPSIIKLRQPWRFLLAHLISLSRLRKAKNIYRQIGNKSTINEETEAQRAALEKKLNELDKKTQYKVYTVMRYWHPRANTVIRQVQGFAPTTITLLPLYPQYSDATTGSSLREWKELARKNGLKTPTRTICCYPVNTGFIQAYTDIILHNYRSFTVKPRILFSAHGLPVRQITAGDPYEMQIHYSVNAIINLLHNELGELDYKICYQSKVGPLKWLEPSIESEIKAAAAKKTPLLVVPIAFVSEHSETKVELDIEYRKLAEELGIAEYIRCATVSVQQTFITGLAELCLQKTGQNQNFTCPADRKLCYCQLQDRT